MGVLIVVCFVVRYFMAILVLQLSCLVMVEWFFLVVPWVCLRFVIVVFPDHTHYFRDKLKRIECLKLPIYFLRDTIYKTDNLDI